MPVDIVEACEQLREAHHRTVQTAVALQRLYPLLAAKLRERARELHKLRVALETTHTKAVEV